MIRYNERLRKAEADSFRIRNTTRVLSSDKDYEKYISEKQNPSRARDHIVIVIDCIEGEL
jgi:hypothetical protein